MIGKRAYCSECAMVLGKGGVRQVILIGTTDTASAPAGRVQQEEMRIGLLKRGEIDAIGAPVHEIGVLIE